MNDAEKPDTRPRAPVAPASELRAVHQFHTAVGRGDGVSNGMFLTQKILRRLGYESEIYAEGIPAGLGHVVHNPSKFVDRPGDVLLIHHSLGYRNLRWLHNVAAKKVLVYHNITPDFLLPEGPLRDLSRLGRDQLHELRPLVEASFGDSEENARELEAFGYRNVAVLPLLVDLDRYAAVRPNPSVMAPLQDSVNILFVGRIADNKRQTDLVDCFNFYHRHFEPRSRLQLVGSVTSPGYLAQLRRKVERLELTDVVSLAGKVSDEDLLAHYQIADVYLSLSEHEGFGMPLIEAMALGVPVVAHASTSIPWTVGPGGLLLQTRDPEYVAATLDLVVRQAGLRRAMRRGARRSLARFAGPVLERELATLLQALGGRPVSAPRLEPAALALGTWRIEGPFESNDRSAMTNRNLALALSEAGLPTGLLSTEGTFPETSFLVANPAVRELVEVGRDGLGQQVTLRCCEPPRTEGLRGLVRVVHSAGADETSMPSRYVDWFNQRLDLVTVPSNARKRLLMDAGVKVPIAVVGLGADHLTVSSVPRTRSTFRFLHVSECVPPQTPHALLKAWQRAFSKDDDVCLVLKFEDKHSSMGAEIRAFAAKYPFAAPIELADIDLDEVELAQLYQTADAFVSAGRGAAEGLPLAQAMLHGLPVIATAWGGQGDLCDDQTAWLVPSTLDASPPDAAEGTSVWAEPDVKQLAARLRDVFTSTELARKVRTDLAHARIAEASWARVAAKTRAAVEALLTLPQLEPELQVGWLTTWNSSSVVAQHSRRLVGEAAFAGPILADRTFERIGEDGERVVRCWDAAQPSENLDHVFEQMCARRVDAVVIQYDSASFALAVLARLVARLRQHGIAVYCLFHSSADEASLEGVRGGLATATRLFVDSLAELNRFNSHGLANATLWPHVERGERLRKVIESCAVDKRFDFALFPERAEQQPPQPIAPSQDWASTPRLTPSSRVLSEWQEALGKARHARRERRR